MIFLDTNVFLRFLLDDDPEKSRARRDLFEGIENGAEATTSEIVLAEIVYVLSSRNLYGRSRADIRALLRSALHYPSLIVANKLQVLDAIDLYGQYNLDFEDCLIAAQMDHEGIELLVSYDRGFDRLKTIVRREPGSL
jgi:predicted nucleic acid-binding protein